VVVSVLPADDPHDKVDIVKAPADAMPGDAGTARSGSHQELDRRGRFRSVANAPGDDSGHVVLTGMPEWTA
jgi:hypothetical protein